MRALILAVDRDPTHREADAREALLAHGALDPVFRVWFSPDRVDESGNDTSGTLGWAPARLDATRFSRGIRLGLPLVWEGKSLPANWNRLLRVLGRWRCDIEERWDLRAAVHLSPGRGWAGWLEQPGPYAPTVHEIGELADKAAIIEYASEVVRIPWPKVEP